MVEWQGKYYLGKTGRKNWIVKKKTLPRQEKTNRNPMTPGKRQEDAGGQENRRKLRRNDQRRSCPNKQGYKKTTKDYWRERSLISNFKVICGNYFFPLSVTGGTCFPT